MPKAKSIDDVKKYIDKNFLPFSLTGNSIIKNNTKIFEFKCEKCGEKFNKSFYKFKKQLAKCPRCASIMRKSSIANNGIEKFKKFFKTISDNYELLSEYTGDKEKIHLLCKKCNNDFWPLPYNLKNGSGCYYCGMQSTREKHIERMKLYTKDIEDVRRRVKEQVGDEYSVSGEYKNNKSLLLFKHNSEKCNFFEFKMSTCNFLFNGHRCPFCAESKGEKRINEWLLSKDIKFSRQYSINDCKNIYLLKFDFAIFNKDGEIIQLIEYNGIQHYKPVNFFGGKLGFEKQVENDKIKYEYCVKKDIPLLVIPYTQYNKIESILEKQSIIFNDYPNGGEIPQQE